MKENSGKRTFVAHSISKQSIALFINGAARAAILPYAPVLVYQISELLNIQQEEERQTIIPALNANAELIWPELAWRVAILVALCSAAHGVGSNLTRLLYYRSRSRDDVVFGSMIGLIVALLAFSTGSNSYHELLVWRSAASLAAGAALCVPNHNRNSKEYKDASAAQFSFTNIYTSYEHVPLGWVLGFAITVLLGGVLYDPLRNCVLFRRVSTGEIFPTLLFLIFCVVSAAISIPKWILCGSFKTRNVNELPNEISDYGLEKSYSTELNEDTYDIEAGLVPVNNGSIRKRGSQPQSRIRMESNFSEVSEYFDCASVFGDVDELDINDNKSVNADRARGLEIVQYKDGKCVYSDGTPASVPSGSMRDCAPKEYMEICYGDRVKADRMWSETKRWRMENNIWNIHSLPHVNMEIIKESYYHVIHGVTKQGYPIMYEFPGKMKLKTAFNAGLGLEDMFHHFAYMKEYLLNNACESEEVKQMRKRHECLSMDRGTVVVLDLTGFSMSHLSSLVIQYLKGAGELESAHYPLFMKKAVIINAPFWISGAWSAVKIVLPESVQESTVILSSTYLSSLQEFIDDDQIPAEMGGSSPYVFDQHPLETRLMDQVKSGIDTSKTEATSAKVEVEHSTSSQTKLSNLTQTNLCEIDNRKYSFDHVQQKWTLDDSSLVCGGGIDVDDQNSIRSGLSMTLNSGRWTTEISTTKNGSLRSRNRFNTLESMDENDDIELCATNPLHVDVTQTSEDKLLVQATTPLASNLSGQVFSDKLSKKILWIVSIMYASICAIQGSLEAALPLWMLAPPILGGLGYDSRKSGVSIFCASMALIFFLRSKIARGLLQLPTKAPLRAFRVGVGTEVALLIIMAIVPPVITKTTKNESMIVLTTTVVVTGGMALAITLGRAGAAILHRIACASYSSSSHHKNRSLFVKACDDGSFTGILGIISEIGGAILTAPLFGWSTMEHRPFPFDGACIFCFVAVICCCVYTLSLSLYVNVIGLFDDNIKQERNHPAPSLRGQKFFGLENHRMPSKCSLVGDMFAVPIVDMASLIEDAKWSLSSDAANIGRKGV